MPRFFESYGPTRKRDVADALAIALSASIPLSTSVTSILAACWLIAVLPVVDLAALKAELRRPASLLPVLLFGFAVAGLFWADIVWKERLSGLEPFLKLLVVPLLAVQFRISSRGYWVLGAYLAACAIALIGDLAMVAVPSLYWRPAHEYPAVFKSPATQSGEFLACVSVLIVLALYCFRQRRFKLLAASLILSAGFVGVTAFFATARTPWTALPVILLVLAFREFSRRGAIVFLVGAAVVVGALFYNASYLQRRIEAVWGEIETYRTSKIVTSSGERIEFWNRSVKIIGDAPFFGHGTGSIYQQMVVQTKKEVNPYTNATPNPHQQTFAVAIQLGVVGVLLLWAMWIYHLAAVLRPGIAAWIGVVVVIQNIIGSLFNSHLFDFTQGWTYVVGVGVVIGMLERESGMRTVAS